MLTIEDIIFRMNEIGEENFSTELQIEKFEQSIQSQEFAFIGYVASIKKKNENINLELFSNSYILKKKVLNKNAEFYVSLLHPLEKNSYDFTKFNLDDDVKVICRLKKIEIKKDESIFIGENYKIYISGINLESIEILITAKQKEEEKVLLEKKRLEEVSRRQEEWRKMNDAATAKAELEKFNWWLKIFIIPGILFLFLFLFFIYWFFNM